MLLMRCSYSVGGTAAATLAVPHPARPWYLGEREYAPTFYPGTTSIEAAQLVEVDAGEEATIDFPLTTVLTATVSGHVVDEYGRPVTGVPSVSLIRDGTSGAAGSRSSGRLEADGRFVIDTVEHLAGIAPAAEPFSLGDGETRRISLALRAAR